MAILEIKGVSKQFGTLRALDGIDISVEQNTFHGLIGPNGSGKSTLLKAIAGDHYADEGSVIFNGMDITDRSPEFRAKNGLNLKFQIFHKRVYQYVLLTHYQFCKFVYKYNFLLTLSQSFFLY